MAADFSIKWKGTDKLLKHFTEAQAKRLVRQVVKTNGAEMQKKMVVNTNLFTGSHYPDGRVIPGTPTGATKRSITGNVEDNGLTYRAGPTTDDVDKAIEDYADENDIDDLFNAVMENLKTASLTKKITNGLMDQLEKMAENQLQNI